MHEKQFIETFIDVTQKSQSICQHPITSDLKYCTRDNFAGRIIDGYEPHPIVQACALLSREAAKALIEAQHALNEAGYSIVVHDSYRPRRAVLDFLEWSKLEELNELEEERKRIHYPNITKEQLFTKGYLDYDSSHCYGNTVDLMLLELESGEMADMGAPFDYMDTLSHLDVTKAEIGEGPYEVRKLLNRIMTSKGFEPYHQEFWHFSYLGKSGRVSQHAIDIPLTRMLIERMQNAS